MMKWFKNKKGWFKGLLISLTAVTIPGLALAFCACSDQQKYDKLKTISLADAATNLNSYQKWKGDQTQLASEINANNFWDSLDTKPYLFDNEFNYSFIVSAQNNLKGSLDIQIKITSKKDLQQSLETKIFTVTGYLKNTDLNTISQNLTYIKNSNNTLTITGIKNSKSILLLPNILNVNNQNLNVSAIGANAFMNQNINTVIMGSNIKSIGKNAFNSLVHLVTYSVPDKISITILNAFSKQTSFINHDSSVNGVLNLTSYNDRANQYQTLYYTIDASEKVRIYGALPAENKTGWYVRVPNDFVFENKLVNVAQINLNYASQEDLYNVNLNSQYRLISYGNSTKPLVITNAPSDNRSNPNPPMFYYQNQEFFGEYAIIYTRDNGTWQYCCEAYQKFGYVNMNVDFAVNNLNEFLLNANQLNVPVGLFADAYQRQWLAATAGTNNIPVPWHFLALPMSTKGITKVTNFNKIGNVPVWPNMYIYGQAHGKNYTTQWNYIYVPYTYKNGLGQIINNNTQYGKVNINSGNLIVNTTDNYYLSNLKTYFDGQNIKLDYTTNINYQG